MNVILGLLAAGFRLVNRRVPWHRMPSFPAVLNLASLRHDLRKRNLFGTQRPLGPTPSPERTTSSIIALQTAATTT